MGLPARGYSWEKFQKGHMLRLTHGARSRRVYEPIAQELAVGLLESRPDLARYPEAVADWSTWEARRILVERYLAEREGGMFAGKDELVEGLLRWEARFASNAREARRLLGLDPRSEAELARAQADAAFDIEALEALRAQGRAVIEERQARGDLEAVEVPAS